MDTTNTEPPPTTNTPDHNGSKKTGLAALVPRFSGLRGKLIIPYVTLTLLLAMLGIFVVTRLVTSSLQERFANTLYETSRAAADNIVLQEQTNLQNLRLMVFTQGVPEALAAGDVGSLKNQLIPLVENYKIELLTLINQNGSVILNLHKDQITGNYITSFEGDLALDPIVKNILQGYQDDKGDKFVRVVNTPFGPALITSAPVRDSAGSLAGVMLVGTRLESLLSTSKAQSLADIILLDENNNLLNTTFTESGDTFAVLRNAGVEATAFTSPKIQELSLYGRQFQILYSPFILRQQPVGLLGVAMPSSYVVSTEATSRNTFSLLFTLGTSATILIGYLLAQNIARPILRLRTMSQSVASGDLNQTINLKRSDEIGDLASAFDQMTSHLRERTEEAERLYAETVQRNQELAAINARLQETQLQLIQSEKLAAIGQLTAGIVHDVKNPLTVIKGTAELMQEEPDLADDVRKELSMIRESAVKANNIVTDLLKFARQTTPELKSQDLRETVQASIRLTTYLSRQAQVKVELSLPEEPMMVSYDAQQVEQVFINLIANAIQAMPDRGSLQVKLDRNDGMAAVAFADTGTGIPPEVINRIFDPFFTTKPEGQGTGLGLSVSYGIIASHQGRIEVQSQVGQGTTFTVLLPFNQTETPLGGDNQ